MSLAVEAKSFSGRNVRETYLNSLGFNNTNFVETLIQQEIIDKNKLNKVIQQFGIQQPQRKIIWMILLDILPLSKEAREFVQQQRTEQYNDLKNITNICKKGIFEKIKIGISEYSSIPQSLVLMWYTKRHYCEYGSFQIEEESFQDLLHIATIIHHICGNEIDSFWCFHNLLDRTNRTNGQLSIGISRQLKVAIKLLELHEPKIVHHLEEKRITLGSFATSWFSNFFASFLPKECILRLLDLVIGISPDIMGCLVVILLQQLKQEIIKAINAKSILEIVRKGTINHDFILDKAKEMLLSVSEKKIL